MLLLLASLIAKPKQGFGVREERKAQRHSVFIHSLVVSLPVPFRSCFSLNYKVYGLGALAIQSRFFKAKVKWPFFEMSQEVQKKAV